MEKVRQPFPSLTAALSRLTQGWLLFAPSLLALRNFKGGYPCKGSLA